MPCHSARFADPAAQIALIVTLARHPPALPHAMCSHIFLVFISFLCIFSTECFWSLCLYGPHNKDSLAFGPIRLLRIARTLKSRD